MLKEKQIKAVSLGPQRLRTETAGVFVAAWGYEKCFSHIALLHIENGQNVFLTIFYILALFNLRK